ncbi:MAG: TetR/AcrR family transcriptional regulator [Oscillospiraceae bacterium]|nr:TetR/AcrR family transcriptional regulator [Oscillospiraceae bacterium]
MILDAYIQLLDENPTRRITVNDIVKRCGASRNTFYYYFPDLSYLVEAIEERWLDLFRLPSVGESYVDCFKPLADYAVKHRVGLLYIYRNANQTRFCGSLDRMWDAIMRRYVEALAEGAVSREDCEQLIRFFKCVFVGMTLDWLDAGMSYDILENVRRVSGLLYDDGMRKKLRFSA